MSAKRAKSRSTQGGLSLGTIVGQTGVEKIYNELLMGAGRRAPRRRQQHRAARSASSTKIQPVEGRRVQLTLNLSMQKAAEEGVPALSATGARRSCSIRADGDVLTLVSLPAYDPNAFAGGIDRAT